MSEEGDNFAKGFWALVFIRSTLRVIPRDVRRAVDVFKELLPWLRTKEHDDEAYDVAHVWYLMATFHMERMVEGVDEHSAIPYFEKAVAKGHALAQCDLGLCYDVGKGVKKSHDKAMSYFLASADQGYHVAQRNAGLCYEAGDGCERDFDLAFQYTEMAVEQGNGEASYGLAMHYFYGTGVQQSSAKGVEYCKLGASRGDLDCIYTLADCYLRGYVVERNETLGFQYLQSNADLNHSLSQVYIAKCFREGRGVKEDIMEAVRYLRRVQKGIGNSSSSENKNDMNVLNMSKNLLKLYEQDYKEQVCLDFVKCLHWL